MVVMKVEARVSWKAGVRVSSWEDFGEVRWSVVSGILRGGGVGFC